MRGRGLRAALEVLLRPETLVQSRPRARLVLRVLEILTLVAFLAVFLVRASQGVDAPSFYDSTDGHFGRAVAFDAWLRTDDLRFLQRRGEPIAWEKGLSWDRYPLFSAYPPLVYLSSIPFLRLLPSPFEALRWSVLPWTLLLLTGLWALGRRLAGPWGALGCLALGTVSPLLLAYRSWYVLDLPAAAVCAWALYFLFASEALSRTRPTLAWGLCCGLALLCKWTSPLFLAPPAILLLTPALLRSRRLIFAGLPFLIPVLILILGAHLSARAASSPRYWMEGHRWLLYLFVSVGPALGLGAAWIVLQERRARRSDDPEALLPLWRFAGAIGLLVMVAAPWSWWALGDILANAAYNVEELAPRSFADTLGVLSRILGESLPAPALLLGLGLLSIPFARASRRRELLALTVSALGVLAFFAQTGKPGQLTLAMIDGRLLLPALVLLLPLGAAWLGRSGLLALGLLPCLLGYGARHAHEILDVVPPRTPPPLPEVLLSELAELGPPGVTRTALVLASGSMPVLTRNEPLYAHAILRADTLLSVGHANATGEDAASLVLPSCHKLEGMDIVAWFSAGSLDPRVLGERLHGACDRRPIERGTLSPLSGMNGVYLRFAVR